MHVSAQTSDPPDPPWPAADEPSSVADGVSRQLDPRIVPAETIGGWITTAVIGGLSLPVLLFAWAAGWMGVWALGAAAVLWPLVTGLLVWQTLWVPRRTYETTRYIVRPDGVEIHRGIFWKT